MLERIMRWIRPSALKGWTTGLPYVGDVQSHNGTSRVYSNLEVVSHRRDSIVFEGDASVDEHGNISVGSCRGKIVTLFDDELGTQHYFSVTF